MSADSRTPGDLQELDGLRPALAGAAAVTRSLGAGPTWGCVIVGARAHGVAPDTSGWHKQRLFALNVILQGRGEFTDSAGRRHELRPGSAYQRLASGKAAVRIDPASDCIECFLLADPRTAEGLRALHLLPTAEIFHAGAPRLLAEEFLELRDACLRPHHQTGRRALLARVIHFLGAVYDRGPLAREDAFWERVVAKAARRLEEEPGSRQSLPELARELKVAYPSFRRAFTRLKGVSPAKYRIRRRMEAACRLLGQHSVKEVAERLGYGDPFTFSSQFKEHTGAPPSVFREQLRAPV